MRKITFGSDEEKAEAIALLKTKPTEVDVAALLKDTKDAEVEEE